MDNWCWWRVSYLKSVNIISCFFFNKRYIFILFKIHFMGRKEKSYNFKINNVNQHCITIKTREIMKKGKKKKIISTMNTVIYCHIPQKEICTKNIHYYWIELIKSILEATKTYFVSFVGKSFDSFEFELKSIALPWASFDFWGQQFCFCWIELCKSLFELCASLRNEREHWGSKEFS